MIKTYTVLDKPVVENEIQKHMEKALQVLLSYKNKLGLNSIVLVGSFGRGEGSVIFDQGRIRPLNDYDFLLVTEKLLIPQRTLNMVSALIGEKLNIRIDLKMIRHVDLHKLPNTIYYYETKLGGKLLWGIDSPSLMPPFKSDAIPLWDGAFLLLARIVALTLAYPPLCKEKTHFGVEQCLKAVFACSDATLILNGNYHYSYKERSKRIALLLSHQNEPSYMRQLADLAQEATRFKLIPDYSPFPDQEQLWKDVANVFRSVFLDYMAHAYHSSPDIDDVVSKFLATHGKSSIKNIPVWLDFWRYHRMFPPTLGNQVLKHTPMLLVCAALPYFMQSMINSDKSYLTGISYLSKIFPLDSSLSFQSARKIVIDTWETSVH